MFRLRIRFLVAGLVILSPPARAIEDSGPAGKDLNVVSELGTRLL